LGKQSDAQYPVIGLVDREEVDQTERARQERRAQHQQRYEHDLQRRGARLSFGAIEIGWKGIGVHRFNQLLVVMTYAVELSNAAMRSLCYLPFYLRSYAVGRFGGLCPPKNPFLSLPTCGGNAATGG